MRKAMDKNELYRLHLSSSMHRKALKRKQKCGCFYCERIFSSTDIKDWVDNGETALCPFCGIDSVIGEGCGREITDKLLHSMHLAFFESGTGSTVSTPFGEVILLKDGKRRVFNYEAIESKAPYEHVDRIYKIEYRYESDGKEHTVELILDDPECEGCSDFGEDTYAFTADIGGGRITVSYADMHDDFSVETEKDRLKVTIPAEAPTQTLTFGVCYIRKLNLPDDVET